MPRPANASLCKPRTNNDLAAISLSTPIGKHASSKTTVSWYRNRETLDFDGDLQNESRRSNRPEDDAVAFSDIVFTRNLGIRDVAVRQDTVVQANPSHLLEFGLDSHSLRTDWAWRITGDRNDGRAERIQRSDRRGASVIARLEPIDMARRRVAHRQMDG